MCVGLQKMRKLMKHPFTLQSSGFKRKTRVIIAVKLVRFQSTPLLFMWSMVRGFLFINKRTFLQKWTLKLDFQVVLKVFFFLD